MRAAPAPLPARERHGGAPGRGRIRGAGRGVFRHPVSRQRGAQNSACLGRAVPLARAGSAHQRQHRHRRLPGRRRRSCRLAQACRHRHVPRQGAGQGHLPVLHGGGQSAQRPRLALESGLRRALERREFEVYYQPKVDAGSGRIVGAEALPRWNHPDMGLVPPGQFIPMGRRRPASSCPSGRGCCARCAGRTAPGRTPTCRPSASR